MKKYYTLECRTCGYQFGSRENLDDHDDDEETGIPCPKYGHKETYVVSMSIMGRFVPMKDDEEKIPYPPLPTKEKSDRELLLEVLDRVKKLEEEVEHIKDHFVL